jgi:hypothetical protein
MGRLGSLDDGTEGRERAAGNRTYDGGRIGSGNIRRCDWCLALS